MIEVSRRRALTLTGATLVGGVGVVSLTSEETNAEVAWGTLDVTGDDATLSQPPSAVDVSVSGSYEITGPSPVEQSRVVLQIEVGGQAEDMDEVVFMDSPGSGTYFLAANVLDHNEVTADQLLPNEVGQTSSTDITVSVILLAISDGSIIDEDKISTTQSLVLTRDGLELAVKGQGSIDVVA